MLGAEVQYEGPSRLSHTLEDSKAVLEIEPYAVREWLLDAHDLLYTMSQPPRMHYLLHSNFDFGEKIAKKEMHPHLKNKRDLWKGPGGTSPERWKCWKERLQDHQGHADLDVGTKKVAGE
ncbi:unnamed protein product [Aureobasidium vineae]|uniref:Uncharacterized protein n=1 Tax=Aureobasidium vineae TaxID=2773715 RepID=A0A9N8PAC0_9PEZI|nr:unnamed protein product [Aureobasidium vineae]